MAVLCIHGHFLLADRGVVLWQNLVFAPTCLETERQGCQKVRPVPLSSCDGMI